VHVKLVLQTNYHTMQGSTILKTRWLVFCNIFIIFIWALLVSIVPCTSCFRAN